MMNTGTDLAIALSDAPDPVAAGTDLVSTVTVSNLGGKPAQAVEVVCTLPAGLMYRSSTADCAGAGVVTCRLGTVAAGERRSFTITSGVPASLVYVNGGPKQLTNRAEVRSESPDPVVGNNTATEGHPERSYELDERTVDADTDVVLHFKPSDSGLNASTTEGCLKGKYRGADGRMYTFFGCDSVRIVPAK